MIDRRFRVSLSGSMVLDTGLACGRGLGACGRSCGFWGSRVRNSRGAESFKGSVGYTELPKIPK